MAITTKNIFITGKPGSGKTTLIKEACLPFLPQVGGFYTEEIREGTKRMGFRLKTFDGREGVLARKGMKSAYKLDKYGVNLEVLEGIGICSMRNALQEKRVIVIDEVGSMEILSDAFRAALMECLLSPRKVLATIRYNAQPFTDEVKKMGETTLLTVSRDDFVQRKAQLRAWLGAAPQDR